SGAQCGSAIICHTGSTAYAVLAGRSYRFGGWGPAIGDEGSGYWIGRAALRAIGAEYERREEPSELWWQVRRWISETRTDRPNRPYDDWEELGADWEAVLEDFHEAGLSDQERTAVFAFAHQIEREMGLLRWRLFASHLTTPVFRAWRMNEP